MSDESGALSLFHAFTTMLDSMAKLFDARADITRRFYNEMDDTDNQIAGHRLGKENAYRDAARECRAAATKLRKP